HRELFPQHNTHPKFGAQLPANLELTLILPHPSQFTPPLAMSHSNIPGLGFICPGNLTYAGRISPCSLDTVVFGTLALYMFLVVVRRAWKSSRDSSATTTRPRRYPQALHPLMTAVQALVLLICATCLFQTLYLVVLQQTDPTVPLVPTYLLPYSALHFLAWLANYLILSSDKRHNRTYYLPAQAFWLLALVAAQVELYDRTLYLVGTDEEEDGPAKVAPVFVANWVLFAAFVVRYALTWALVIVAGILEWKVHHGDEWGSDGERSDDETVDEVNGRIGQYRRLTPDLNNGDGDVENSPTTISPTPLDDATHALFTNGLGKDYGTLSKRPRRARRASSTTTTTTTATTVPVQTLTSSPHTNYIAKLRRLFPFMWPRNDRRLQLLIVLCLLLLVAERVVNVLLPISYKNVVDALAKEGGGGRVVWKEILIFVGLRMLQGGVGFIGTAQKGLWVPIGQFTTRELQVRMFEHLLNLSLRFHLNRKTGEILRVQDRGVTSIVTLLTTICFNILPTLTDVTVACVYFTLAFDGWFGAIVLTTMAAYVGFTMRLTEWRMRYRRETNRLENEMEAKAGGLCDVDALLNYETVKLYANEKSVPPLSFPIFHSNPCLHTSRFNHRFEVEQYEKAIVSYQQADLKSNTVAMTISTVQNVILQVGLLTGCLLCARRVTMGTMTVGDFVAYIGYMTQLYGPLSGCVI
ncbi:ABC transporter type 1, transmembrane domain-containing protein, partial [Jimgerdemannia flammicorona]